MSDILGSAKKKRRGKKLFDGRNVCNSRKSSGHFFKLAVKWSRLRLRGAFKLVGRLTKKKNRPEAFLDREVVGNLERLVIGK